MKKYPVSCTAQTPQLSLLLLIGSGLFWYPSSLTQEKTEEAVATRRFPGIPLVSLKRYLFYLSQRTTTAGFFFVRIGRRYFAAHLEPASSPFQQQGVDSLRAAWLNIYVRTQLVLLLSEFPSCPTFEFPLCLN